MTKKEIIRNLKYTMEKHKNDRVDTFGTNIFVMCKDILDYLEQEPCGKDINVLTADAISREAVLEWCGDINMDVYTNEVKEFILSLPSVQPKHKTGTWRKDIDNSRRWDRVRFYCSECGSWQTYGETEYCPKCGARMGKEKT